MPPCPEGDDSDPVLNKLDGAEHMELGDPKEQESDEDISEDDGDDFQLLPNLRLVETFLIQSKAFEILRTSLGNSTLSVSRADTELLMKSRPDQDDASHLKSTPGTDMDPHLDHTPNKTLENWLDTACTGGYLDNDLLLNNDIEIVVILEPDGNIWLASDTQKATVLEPDNDIGTNIST
ncbi:hypothetical protein NHQ30_009274 [Ciborinia camelliae]|nr:hypothetical protein NHQ30_009274 [Ciborinia camelliae]